MRRNIWRRRSRKEPFRWLKSFLHESAEIDCDMDFYSAQFEAILQNKIAILMVIKSKVKSFRSGLSKEELEDNHLKEKTSSVL